MATRVSTDYFSEMLDGRLRNFNKRLSPDAIELLNSLEEAYVERRSRSLDFDLDAEDEDPAEGMDRSLDQLIPAIREEVAPDEELITAASLRRILDFFCPGLPPLC